MAVPGMPRARTGAILRADQDTALASVHPDPDCPGSHRRPPAGAEPLPPAEPGAAIEVDRIVSKGGQVHLASRYVIGLVIFVDIPGARTAGIVADADLLLALL